MISRILLGFVAGAIAVLAVHQPIIAGLAAAKLLPATAVPYNMATLGSAPAWLNSAMASSGYFKGWPTLFNLMFWGGLWGAFYGLALARLPFASWVKGLLLGICVVVAGNWLLVPYFKKTAYFGGYEPMRMLVTSMINLPFGIATGIIYGLFRRNG